MRKKRDTRRREERRKRHNGRKRQYLSCVVCTLTKTISTAKKRAMYKYYSGVPACGWCQPCLLRLYHYYCWSQTTTAAAVEKHVYEPKSWHTLLPKRRVPLNIQTIVDDGAVVLLNPRVLHRQGVVKPPPVLKVSRRRQRLSYPSKAVG